MGILKAVHGAMGSVLEEQWREFFTCDSLSDETLLVRGFKHIGKNSQNRRLNDDVLTNGSILSVADGQCVLVVKQGKVIDVCAEPGEHVFEDPEQGGLKNFFREVGKRVSFGGGDIQPTVHRVYYLNVKELTGLRFESPAIPFRAVDRKSGLDLDAPVSVSGVCSYCVADPVKLYRTIIGNVSGRYTRQALNRQLAAQLRSCLQPALAALAKEGVRPNELPEHIPALCEALQTRMNEGWCAERGLELSSVAIDSCVASGVQLLQSSQYAQMLQDPSSAGAALIQAAAEALPLAAAAPGRAVLPLVSAAAPAAEPAAPVTRGMAPAARETPPVTRGMAPVTRETAPATRQTTPAARAAAPELWICSCGARNTRRFCPDCGKPRPSQTAGTASTAETAELVR